MTGRDYDVLIIGSGFGGSVARCGPRRKATG
jgi:succinate dehydrogenase/fumarate reductase flavoprotein subunit